MSVSEDVAVVRVQFNDEWIVRFHVSPASVRCAPSRCRAGPVVARAEGAVRRKRARGAPGAADAAPGAPLQRRPRRAAPACALTPLLPAAGENAAGAEPQRRVALLLGRRDEQWRAAKARAAIAAERRGIGRPNMGHIPGPHAVAQGRASEA